jgi:hypothetical protein
MKKFLALLIIFLAAAGFATPVSAMSVSPATRVVTIDPEKKESITLRVENNEAVSRTLHLSISGVKQDAAGRPVFGQGFDDAESWVRPATPDFVLGSGQSKEVAFTLTIPPGAFPGSHWVALAVESVAGKATDRSELNERLVSLLSIQVSGVVNESAVVSADLARSFVVGSGNAPLAVRVANVGTIEIPLRGVLVLRSLDGSVVSERPFSLGNQLIPKAERSVEEKIFPGRSKECLALASGNNCFDQSLPGLYRLETRVIYGKTEQIMTTQTSFWYLPLWSVVVGLLVMSGSMVLILRYRRKRTFERYVAAP